jgi:acetolactate synthase small subunit
MVKSIYKNLEKYIKKIEYLEEWQNIKKCKKMIFLSRDYDKNESKDETVRICAYLIIYYCKRIFKMINNTSKETTQIIIYITFQNLIEYISQCNIINYKDENKHGGFILEILYSLVRIEKISDNTKKVIMKIINHICIEQYNDNAPIQRHLIFLIKNHILSFEYRELKKINESILSEIQTEREYYSNNNLEELYKYIKNSIINTSEKEYKKNINLEYIYLFHTYDCIASEKNIFKIGKTCRHPWDRYSEYPRGTQIIQIVGVTSCDNTETYILEKFKKKFNQCKEFGNEYFEGEIKEIDEYFSLMMYEYKKQCN